MCMFSYVEFTEIKNWSISAVLRLLVSQASIEQVSSHFYNLHQNILSFRELCNLY